MTAITRDISMGLTSKMVIYRLMFRGSRGNHCLGGENCHLISKSMGSTADFEEWWQAYWGDDWRDILPERGRFAPSAYAKTDPHSLLPVHHFKWQGELGRRLKERMPKYFMDIEAKKLMQHYIAHNDTFTSPGCPCSELNLSVHPWKRPYPPLSLQLRTDMNTTHL
jgi:hypothetical protein